MKNSKTNLNIIVSSLCFLFVASVSVTSAATVTSVTNGNWLNPTTWDCNCIPQITDNIIIAHNVTLNTDWGINGGSLTINNGASLREDSQIRNIAFNGGTVTLNGVMDISRIAFINCTVTNNDSIYAQAIYSTGNITNSGHIFNVDSVNTNGIMQNLSNGTLSGLYFLSTNQFQNDGNITMYDFLQTGEFTNDGTINITNDFANTGFFYNNSNLYVDVDGSNSGKFNNNGSATCTIMSDFINDDSLLTKTALVKNDGLFEVWVDMSNLDSLSGSGTYCIGQYTSNSGIMSGNFDFCDKTPPANPPYIDVNTGTIDTNITWCANSLCLPVADNPIWDNYSKPVVSPNPNHGTIQILMPEGISFLKFSLFDLSGRLLMETKSKIIVNNSLNLKGIVPGCYLYTIKTADQMQYSDKMNIVE